VENSNLLLTLAVILVGAKLGGTAAQRFGFPSVFGKLVVGLALGPALLNLLEPSPALNALADLGVILLMFIAGLETDMAQMRKVGAAAFLAASGGVALPMAAGVGLALAFGMSTPEAFFIGTILTATSVGITAQTLTELGRLRSKEGSAILAAAVIDDVMGVLVLSLVLAFDTGGDPVGPVIRMSAFIPLALLAGVWAVPFVIDRILHLEEQETRTAVVIAIALVYAWAAEYFGGLAPITGAYLAGLMIGRTAMSLHATESLNRIAYAFFIPLFFVVVGLRMDSSALTSAPLFALALIAVAIVTKVAGAGLGSLAGGFSPREATRVGFGMVSRGEVALVVAVIGFDHAIIGAREYSATILMTLVTTMVTPVLLKLAFRAEPRPVPARPAPSSRPIPAVRLPESVEA
jgi:Kef-type K+ transport system membrane component KefB